MGEWLLGITIQWCEVKRAFKPILTADSYRVTH